MSDAQVEPAVYPQRPPFFAHWFVRLMAEVRLPMEIGTDACWLLASIAHQEDALGYQRAITYFNDQLITLLGKRSDEGLAVARNKAVTAGWLHYEPGRKGVPGRYWVTVPKEHTPAQPASVKATKGRRLPPGNAGRKPGSHPEDNAGRNRNETADHSSLFQDTQEPKNPKAVPAAAGDAAKPPRPRRPVFDAIVTVTGADPAVNGKRIGVLCSLLAQADPPYTPAEVLRFADPAFVRRELPWLTQPRLTVDQLQSHIGRVRSSSPEPVGRPPPMGGFKTKREAADEYAAAQMFDGINTLYGATT